MRVRIIALPRIGELDEMGLRRRFRIGDTYELPVQLAATLIIAGYAEGAGAVGSMAADTARRRHDDK